MIYNYIFFYRKFLNEFCMNVQLIMKAQGFFYQTLILPQFSPIKNVYFEFIDCI